jgi:uncharacterized SAM-binding protein YcdF (DUF218 family)
MVKRFLWLALSGTGILALLGLILFTWLWVQINRFGQVDRAQRADVIVVLGARVWPSGRPSDALTRRTLHAVKLYQEGLAAMIVCSGGLGTHPPTEAQAAARLAMDQGVPSEAIVLEEKGHSTEESAFFASDIMRAQGWQKAIVVSDAYHLWRAKLLFGKAGVEVYPSPAYDERYPLSRRVYLYHLGREVVAVAWYYVKSRLGLSCLSRALP